MKSAAIGILRRGTVAVVLGSCLAAMVGAGVADVRLQGSGATFPNPLYQRWVGEYQKINPSVRIDYQSIGSGGGIKAITEKTVDFAGSDAPLSKKEILAMGGAEHIVQVPSCAGSVVPAYNVPGVAADIKFTGEVLAEIFMGKITRWNDAKLTALNVGIALPDSAITPAYRNDGSGTTFVWTNYLATQSESFKETVGLGKQVKWPVGQGGKGNEGVAAVVQQTPGAIGYLELNYAIQNKIDFGSVKNQAGKFVKATTNSVSAAGEGAVKNMTGSVLEANIWNQPGADAYPVASFTYLIFYKDLNNLKNKDEAQALINFVRWATDDGQNIATEMDYAPLSKGVRTKVRDALAGVTYKGDPIK
jgi:phosphate transport system substrate-binding protein